MQWLEICGDGLDGARVMGWMCFPDSPELRQTLLAREILEAQMQGESVDAGAVSTPRWVVQCLLRGPGHHEIKERVGEATKRGTVAGDLLGLIYRMHFEGAKEPSLNKAIGDYRKFALGEKPLYSGGGARYGDGSPLRYADQTLRDCLDEFKSVAHLWAAYRLNATEYAFTTDRRDFFRDTATLATCLGVAKGVGEFAATFMPKRTESPVIERSLMVQIPAEIPALHLRMRRATPHAEPL